jgi:hypothetical protein
VERTLHRTNFPVKPVDTGLWLFPFRHCRSRLTLKLSKKWGESHQNLAGSIAIEDPMAKFKPLNENQLVMLPISLQDQIVPGTLEYTISRVVDEHIDLAVFDARSNNDETGATAIHPKITPRSC